MAKQSVIPFGPQHPVFPEPLQLKLVMEEERVVQAVPVIGYVHRGLEKLAEQKDFIQDVYLVERICGICSFMHAQNFCQGIEELMSITVPDRARFLRVIWGEMHRIHSHLLWLGLLADGFGFENLFMQAWRCREKVLDILEATAGGRVMLSACCIGGVRRDLNDEQIKAFLAVCDELERDLNKLVPATLNDYSVKQRTVGVGKLTKEQAYATGAVGPVAKASGLAIDLRTTGYAAYKDLDFKPIFETAGDCYARTVVRAREMFQCIDLVRKALKLLPGGPVAVPFKGNPPAGEVIARLEQPRGEVFYYIKGNGTKNLERLRVRTPTFANIPALLAMLPGCELADVPVITLSIDPCISCTER